MSRIRFMILGSYKDNYTKWYEGKDMSFNGTSQYIDTGIKLFNVDKSWTVLLTYTSHRQSGYYDTIIHSLKEDTYDYAGFVLDQPESGYNYGRLCGYDANAITPHNTTMYNTKHCCVIVKNGSTAKIFTDDKYPNGTSVNNIVKGTYSGNTLLGCYQTTSGSKGRYWKGIIHNANIYSQALSDTQIIELIKNYMK